MAIQDIVSEVTDFFINILNKDAHVIGVEKRESGWLVLVETIEESEYMRKRALDDTVGLYEVEISDKMEILNFKRTAMRERDEIHQDNEE